MSERSLSHVDSAGKSRMVNVAKKPITRRVAIAKGEVQMAAKTLELIKENKMKKGDVLGVAQIAGIQGAKRTAELIPFCHPIQMDHISVRFSFDDNLPGVQIEGQAECEARTGVEMEALTAVSVAALTIYDMAKSADKTMRIGSIRLVKKTGGQSGDVSNE